MKATKQSDPDAAPRSRRRPDRFGPVRNVAEDALEETGTWLRKKERPRTWPRTVAGAVAGAALVALVRWLLF